MSWPKPNMINTLKPPVKLHGNRWVVFFIVLIIITGILLAFMWTDNDYFSQWKFWVSVLFISTVISGVALSIRLYLYGLAQEEYEIWKQEQNNIEQNWQMWAMQSLVVLDSHYIVPNKITAKELIFDSDNISVQVNNSLTFDDQSTFKNLAEDLFFSLRQVLSNLPAKEPINITIYSSSESYSYIDEEINHAYQSAKISQPYKLTHQIVSRAENEKLIQWIDNPQSALQLIIINNTISSGSAFLCAFLLTDKEHYQNLDIDIAKCEILRPMITDDLLVGINQMNDIQPAIHQINQLWFANMSNQQEVNLTKLLADLQISPEQIYKLESLLGNQTELSYWLSLAMGCDMITQTKQNNLITAMSRNQWLFSVVTTVSKES
ncbi:hypothetical protein [uncultured Gilliamella sp.]|uniref:hypothetical protein n=1 Tax=uncultured Gilliamella sp. TaxID=1193505 RepID=UPI0026007E5C|nr:hypothetical protein [uncultured Gilliamella sp.]